MRQISEKQIEEINRLIESRKDLEVKNILKELPEIKKESDERLRELDEFAKEVKRRIRSSGKSLSIGVSDFEDLFVKYNIKL